MEGIIPTFPEFLTSILRLAVWLTILSAIFVPLERLFAVHPQRFFRRAIGTDLGYFFLTGLTTSALLGFPVAVLAWVAHHAVPSAVVATMSGLPLWGRLIAALVVGEFGYYWGHRWCHEVPFLWRFHAVHHSAEAVDFLVNTRAHPFDMVFGRLCGFVPMYLLGLGGPTGEAGSLVPILVALIGTAWGFFIHANLRWRFGPLEWLVSTPAFHHWHHTRTGPINRNYASTLPWLDWLFGTFHLPRGNWPESYGITSAMPDSLTEQLVHPLWRPSATDSSVASTSPTGGPISTEVSATPP